VQTERSKLRDVEMMEWIDERHEQDKRRRAQDKRQREQEEQRQRHYERFKVLYWGAGAIAFFVATAGWGLLIGDFLRVLQPKTVIIQVQPAPSPEQLGSGTLIPPSSPKLLLQEKPAQ
jgi:Flp pilus assembly protein TadB